MTRSVNYISDMPLFSLLNLSKTLYRVIIILKSTSLYSFFHSVLDLLVYGVEFSSLQTSSYRDLIQKERTHHYNLAYSWKYADTIEEFKFVHMLKKFPLFPFWIFNNFPSTSGYQLARTTSTSAYMSNMTCFHFVLETVPYQLLLFYL